MTSWVQDVAWGLLAKALPRRWAHVQGVASKAEHVAASLALSDEALVAAAWLHDVGYAPEVTDTGFHPLDGARYLAGAGVPERVVNLVARHSYAILEGCGSFEVSWLRCEDMAVAVSGVVDAFVLAAEVEAPVVLEVAGGDEGAELEDGLGAFEAPSCARYVHSVLDDVPAGALDYPGGDGPAFLQRGGVVQVSLLVLQVAGAFVGAGALGRE